MIDATQETYNKLSDEIKEKIKKVEEQGLTRVDVHVHFIDDDSEMTATIAIMGDYSEDNIPDDDEEIFYYCNSISDLIGLFEQEDCNDFYITDIYL
jgi:glutathionylspermidine synthase